MWTVSMILAIMGVVLDGGADKTGEGRSEGSHSRLTSGQPEGGGKSGAHILHEELPLFWVVDDVLSLVVCLELVVAPFFLPLALLIGHRGTIHPGVGIEDTLLGPILPTSLGFLLRSSHCISGSRGSVDLSQCI